VAIYLKRVNIDVSEEQNSDTPPPKESMNVMRVTLFPPDILFHLVHIPLACFEDHIYAHSIFLARKSEVLHSKSIETYTAISFSSVLLFFMQIHSD